MKKFVRRHILLQLLLPLLFLWHIGSTVLFPHSHIVYGKVIVHSHPYTAKHNHTDNEFETIQYLSVCNLEDYILKIYLPDKISVLLDSFPTLSITDGKYSKHIHSGITRRGPPSQIA